MKLTASILTVFAASILLLQSCGSDTSSDRAELATVLDEAADREGVPSGECRDDCVRAALAVFDACTEDDAGIREECFGRAIHSFFECAKECPPPTCEDRCQLEGLAVLEECLDEPAATVEAAAQSSLGKHTPSACLERTAKIPSHRPVKTGARTPPRRCAMNASRTMANLDECNMEAREWLAACTAEHCEEPPTCEDACGALATHVYDACINHDRLRRAMRGDRTGRPVALQQALRGVRVSLPRRRRL